MEFLSQLIYVYGNCILFLKVDLITSGKIRELFMIFVRRFWKPENELTTYRYNNNNNNN